MIDRRKFARRWKSLAMRRARISIVAAVAIIAVDRSFGTGYFGLDSYLDQGGTSVEASPEFYWDLEVKRLAKDFKAPEKLVVRTAADQSAARPTERSLSA